MSARDDLDASSTLKLDITALLVNKRILVGLIALSIVVPIVVFGGIWSAALVLWMCIGGGHEFYSLLERSHYRPAKWIGYTWITVIVVYYAHPLWSPWFPDISPDQTGLLTLIIVSTLVYSLLDKEKPIQSWFTTLVGILYIGILGGQALALRLLENGLWWLTLGALITWANDTAAYFTGVNLGRHYIWPRLSPKKTWEGTIGGLLGAGVICLLYFLLFPAPDNVSIGLVVGMGIVGGIFGLFGDLSVSMIKRQIGVKDSGNVFPGHGGMLDRMDSLLFVIPFVYQIALFFEK